MGITKGLCRVKAWSRGRNREIVLWLVDVIRIALLGLHSRYLYCKLHIERYKLDIYCCSVDYLDAIY